MTRRNCKRRWLATARRRAAGVYRWRMLCPETTENLTKLAEDLGDSAAAEQVRDILGRWNASELLDYAALDTPSEDL